MAPFCPPAQPSGSGAPASVAPPPPFDLSASEVAAALRRRAATAPACGGSRGTKRNAPTVWELQEALRRHDDARPLTGSIAPIHPPPSSVHRAASSSMLSLPRPPSLELAHAPATSCGQGLWPRMRRQRTPTGSLAAMDMQLACQKGGFAPSPSRSSFEPPTVMTASSGENSPLDHLGAHYPALAHHFDIDALFSGGDPMADAWGAWGDGHNKPLAREDSLRDLRAQMKQSLIMPNTVVQEGASWDQGTPQPVLAEYYAGYGACGARVPTATAALSAVAAASDELRLGAEAMGFTPSEIGLGDERVVCGTSELMAMLDAEADTQQLKAGLLSPASAFLPWLPQDGGTVLTDHSLAASVAFSPRNGPACDELHFGGRDDGVTYRPIIGGTASFDSVGDVDGWISCSSLANFASASGMGQCGHDEATRGNARHSRPMLTSGAGEAFHLDVTPASRLAPPSQSSVYPGGIIPPADFPPLAPPKAGAGWSGVGALLTSRLDEHMRSPTNGTPDAFSFAGAPLPSCSQPLQVIPAIPMVPSSRLAVPAEAFAPTSAAPAGARRQRSRSQSRNAPERKEWSPGEDEYIKRAVIEQGCRWRQIATMLPGRSDDAVRNRWNRLKAEDSAASIVKLDGATAVPDATSSPLDAVAKAKPNVPPNAKARRVDQAAPSGREAASPRVSWSRGEDSIIVTSVAELGHRWNTIAERLPGRTEHAIRNRYHRLTLLTELAPDANDQAVPKRP